MSDVISLFVAILTSLFKMPQVPMPVMKWFIMFVAIFTLLLAKRDATENEKATDWKSSKKKQVKHNAEMLFGAGIISVLAIWGLVAFSSYIDEPAIDDSRASTEVSTPLDKPDEELTAMMNPGDDLSKIEPSKRKEEYFWGQTLYKREDIESIIFIRNLDTLENIALPNEQTFQWTIPSSGSHVIIGKVCNKTLYVAADGRIIFPKDASYLFAEFFNLTEIQFRDMVDTSLVENMCAFFSGCSKLEKIDISSFDTHNVRSMKSMFAACCALKCLDISMLETQNVTEMNAMFYGCKELESINFGSMDTSKVTTMMNMFAYCESMKSFDLSSFNTSNVKDMRHMFRECKKLEKLDLSNFDTSKVTDMDSMFVDCVALVDIDISSFDLSNAEGMENVFLGCSQLKSIDAGSWTLKWFVRTGGFMNEGCTINGQAWEDFIEDAKARG